MARPPPFVARAIGVGSAGSVSRVGMPVFECSRCNHLTYSASRAVSLHCDVCGASRQRVLEHAFSFDEAREEARPLTAGDHCCVWFDDPEQVAPFCAETIRDGLAKDALVLAYPQPRLEEATRALLDAGERERVVWGEPDEVYGLGWDGDEVVARFREIAAAEDRPIYVLGASARPLDTLGTADEFRRFERLATEVAVETGMVVVCLYDRSLQPEGHMTAACETHPLESSGAALRRNDEFVYAGIPS